MKKRIISGAVYTALLVGFFCLKIYVHAFCFDALIYAFAIMGTWEILRAFKDKTTKSQRVMVMIFAIVCIPVCAVTEEYLSFGLHYTCVCFFTLAVALLSLLVLDHDKTTPENLGVSFLSAIYPVLLLSILVLVNHAPAPVALKDVAFNSSLLILFIFVVSPLSDVFAFIFGLSLKKVFPKKLAPTLSPNKTIIGAIGGLIGGMIGACALYFLYGKLAGSYENMGLWLPVYLTMGLLTSAATAFGDLVESCIKRKVGIKDMGKIMPGHGGVLDRIDGTLFASMVVYLAFSVVRMYLI
ncbi:MAG: phosphatidate cytidylyltransferase [Clostridiales bacterium]|nr:phosphatidate cytidylyltransferase [Clostridiales bacterium]